MSQLKYIREKQHLTQQELSENSGVSVRTIQRIESGTNPKGQTLKMLAASLQVKDEELLENPDSSRKEVKPSLAKIINLSSLPVTVFPPANILLPLLIMFVAKKFTPLTRQIVSLQIFWSVCALIIFMLFNFLKSSFGWSNKYTPIMMVILALSNLLIILKNAAELDKKQKLSIKLNFSII
jgi:transcriptional regulator with XRE-family HTH domain